MNNPKLTRRQILGATVLGLPAIPVVVETAFAQAKPAAAAAALPVLSPTEPAAKALGYVEDAKRSTRKRTPTTSPAKSAATVCSGPTRTARRRSPSATSSPVSR